MTWTEYANVIVRISEKINGQPANSHRSYEKKNKHSFWTIAKYALQYDYYYMAGMCGENWLWNNNLNPALIDPETRSVAKCCKNSFRFEIRKKWRISSSIRRTNGVDFFFGVFWKNLCVKTREPTISKPFLRWPTQLCSILIVHIFQFQATIKLHRYIMPFDLISWRISYLNRRKAFSITIEMGYYNWTKQMSKSCWFVSSKIWFHRHLQITIISYFSRNSGINQTFCS